MSTIVIQSYQASSHSHRKSVDRKFVEHLICGKSRTFPFQNNENWIFCSDCCCHRTRRLLLQKYETIFQVHVSQPKNRSAWKRNLEKGIVERLNVVWTNSVHFPSIFYFVVIDFFQLSFEKSGQIPELVKNLKTIRVCELTAMSQKLLSLPEEEQQVNWVERQIISRPLVWLLLFVVVFC